MNDALLQQWRQRCEEQLALMLPSLEQAPQRLHQAMHYAVFNGGKRLRPLLVYATAQAFGGDIAQADHAAVAVELIHCFSLVHDDLPAMDDDDLRRGKPACHKAFDEATAILVGDALQSLAIEILTTQKSLDPKTILTMVKVLADATGSLGMAGGQMLDMQGEGKTLSESDIELMHSLKTGALIRASILLGAYSASSLQEDTLNKLTDFANQLGLAFQIQDDILDCEGNTETLGKPAGADVIAQKASYPAIIGLDNAKNKVKALHQECLQLLSQLPCEKELLEILCDKLILRNK